VSLLTRSMVRYGALGAALNLAAYVLYLFLVEVVNWKPEMSLVFAQVTTLPISFLIIRRTVFVAPEGLARSAALYIAGYAGSMVFQVTNLALFSGVFGAPHFIVAGWGAALAIPMFFFYQSRVVFKGLRSEKSPNSKRKRKNF